MPSNSAVTRLATSISPRLARESATTRWSAAEAIVAGAPWASIFLPSGSSARSTAGAARSARPCETTCSGNPAVPIVIWRPQTSICRPLALTGVHGGTTFSIFPALVFHHLNFRAGASFENSLAASRSTAPFRPTTVNLAEYLPSGSPGRRITPRT